jgi:pimeloyl-ACP methyl ester carboxylesterase
VRSGKFGPKPRSVVLVEHSYGSVVSNALLAATPDIVDAAVLTGIGYVTPSTAVNFNAWQPRLPRLQSLARWRQLDGGYITWVDIFANVNTYVYPCSVSTFANGLRFFKAPFYDTKVVEYAEANKQPFSLMETITLTITNLTSPAFTGPILV